MKKNVFIRTLALALVVLTMATLTVSIAAAADTKKSFSDVPADYWAKTEIQFAVDNGIASGYADGTFKPDAAVTNAQFVTFLARAVYSSEIDKSAAPWYAGALKALNAHGILDGNYVHGEASSFPVDFDKNLTGGIADKNVARYNTAIMLWNVLNEKNIARPKADEWKPVYNAIKDRTSIPSGSVSPAVYVCTMGIMDTQNGNFNSNGTVTRAQACVMLYRLVQKLGGNITAAGPGTNAGTGATAGTATQPVTSSGDQHVLTNGKPITEDNVLEILEQIKKDYPEGTLYQRVNGIYYTDALNGGGIATDGCAGWAGMCSDLIFGKYSNNKAHVLEDHSKIRPGDIIAFRETTTGKTFHYSIVISKYGANTQTIDGTTYYGVYTSNANQNENIVRWTGIGQAAVYEKLDNLINWEWVVTTRYPD